MYQKYTVCIEGLPQSFKHVLLLKPIILKGWSLLWHNCLMFFQTWMSYILPINTKAEMLSSMLLIMYLQRKNNKTFLLHKNGPYDLYALFQIF